MVTTGATLPTATVLATPVRASEAVAVLVPAEVVAACPDKTICVATAPVAVVEDCPVKPTETVGAGAVEAVVAELPDKASESDVVMVPTATVAKAEVTAVLRATARAPALAVLLCPVKPTVTVLAGAVPEVVAALPDNA